MRSFGIFGRSGRKAELVAKLREHGRAVRALDNDGARTREPQWHVDFVNRTRTQREGTPVIR